MSVSVLGWILSATQKLMIARRGYMQSEPITPVNVVFLGWRAAGTLCPRTRRGLKSVRDVRTVRERSP
jgi:hypothetical protein